jgi:hypothetical protein
VVLAEELFVEIIQHLQDLEEQEIVHQLHHLKVNLEERQLALF